MAPVRGSASAAPKSRRARAAHKGSSSACPADRVSCPSEGRQVHVRRAGSDVHLLPRPLLALRRARAPACVPENRYASVRRHGRTKQRRRRRREARPVDACPRTPPLTGRRRAADQQRPASAQLGSRSPSISCRSLRSGDRGREHTPDQARPRGSAAIAIQCDCDSGVGRAPR